MLFKKLVMLAAALFCLSPSAHAVGATVDPAYAPLLAEAEDMDSQMGIMPVKIFNLASRFADMPDKEATAKLVESKLTRSSGKWGFGRRVGYTTLRFMGKQDYTSIDVAALVMRGMDDPVEWVRYDAVWVGEVLELDTPAFRAKLAELAKGYDPAKYGSAPVPPTDFQTQRQRRAYELLQKLEKK